VYYIFVSKLSKYNDEETTENLIVSRSSSVISDRETASPSPVKISQLVNNNESSYALE